MIELKTIDEVNNAIANNKAILLDFWATWCGPCKMIGKTLEGIADEYPELVIAKIEADKAEEVVAEFGVRNVPTLMLYVESGVKMKLTGALSQAALQSKLNEFLK